jgi:hypothetical protein
MDQATQVERVRTVALAPIAVSDRALRAGDVLQLDRPEIVTKSVPMTIVTTLPPPLQRLGIDAIGASAAVRPAWER